MYIYIYIYTCTYIYIYTLRSSDAAALRAGDSIADSFVFAARRTLGRHNTHSALHMSDIFLHIYFPYVSPCLTYVYTRAAP